MYTANTQATLESLEISSNRGIGLWAQVFSDITRSSVISNNASSGISIYQQVDGDIDARDLQLIVLNSIIWENRHVKYNHRIPSVEILHSNSQVHFIHTQMDSIETIPEAQVEVNAITQNLLPHPYFRYHANNFGNDDPTIVQLDTDDFHLTPESPALGAGIDSAQVNGSWYYAPAYDLENQPRPMAPTRAIHKLWCLFRKSFFPPKIFSSLPMN